MDLHQFDQIRPYTDEEVAPAMKRIADSAHLDGVLAYLYPGQATEPIREMFRNISSAQEFQEKVMLYAIRKIVKDTASELSSSGFERIKKEQAYLFISNHRDILLDSAILQVIFFEYQLPTSEISFGDNLMSSDFLIDVGKSNKMFKVLRNANPREFYNNSLLLSQYIRTTVVERNTSIWIAQRNGRTKDGFDTTEQGILKMFDMSGREHFVDDFAELNILPLSVSYEYEPCDVLKTNELYISRRQKYVKMPGEDLNSILTGMMQFKGGIHMSASPVLSAKDIEEIAASGDKNERFKALAQLLDDKIVANYKLWKTNYIAYDLLHQSHTYAGFYAQAELEAFQSYMHYKLSALEGEKEELEEIFLTIYANPVVNSRRFSV